jgi:hypothetical protein
MGVSANSGSDDGHCTDVRVVEGIGGLPVVVVVVVGLRGSAGKRRQGWACGVIALVLSSERAKGGAHLLNSRRRTLGEGDDARWNLPLY